MMNPIDRSSSLATSINRVAGYYAYGSTRTSSGTLQTDRAFTGQKSDSTGLLYYNARYYDPALGTFLSPDTIIPDAGRVIDYNRFLYVRANPLKYSDPSGHETNKPDWWPDWLPYTWDFPDGWTEQDFVQWISENNIPTMVGGHGGGNIGSGLFLGGTISADVQWIFNIMTGELRYGVDLSSGLRIGTLQNGVGVYAGGTFVTGTERFENLEGASKFTSIDVGTSPLKGGVIGTAARAFQYRDLDGNSRFSTSPTTEPLTTPVHDSKFDRTVDTLSIDLTAGVNATSVPVDAGIAHGITATRLTSGGVNFYSPIRAIIGVFHKLLER